MEGNPEKTADRETYGDGDAPSPRIEDLPFRRRLPVFITFVPTLPMGQGLAWGILVLLDPGFEHAFITPSLFLILVPLFIFMSAARPRERLHWAILGVANVVSAFMGTLGFYLAVRLIAPLTEPTMFGELPALLTGMVAAGGLATGVWLLVCRLTRGEGLWLGPMINREGGR